MDLFKRLSEGRPPQEPTPPPTPLAAGKLLGWIQNKWVGSTIRMRDICRLGPTSIRNRENALKAAEALARHGWLIPMEMNRYDAKKWRITLRAD
jgi:hypothetical protein